MSNEDQIRTGLWKNEPGKPAGYGGKITLPDGSEFWVNLYKNDKKETERHPDLNLVLKPKQASNGASQGVSRAPAPEPDSIPF
jgi:hypothetical protein